MAVRTKAEQMADLRKRRTAAGLTRLELWVPKDQLDAVKKFAKELRQRHKEPK